jgi:hypothetical protein
MKRVQPAERGVSALIGTNDHRIHDVMQRSVIGEHG